MMKRIKLVIVFVGALLLAGAPCAYAQNKPDLEKVAVSQGGAQLLPKPLVGSEWEDVRLYVPSQIAVFDRSWKEITTADHPDFKEFSGSFDTVMSSNKESASFSFGFEGDMIGLYDICAPEAGQVEVLIDGKLVQLKEITVNGFRMYEANDRIGSYALNRSNALGDDGYKLQYDLIKVEKGPHQVTIRISTLKANERSLLKQSTIYLGKILLRGKPIQCHRVKGVPKLAQQLKWDEKMRRYEKADADNPPSKGVLLFVGSSTMENWKSLAKDFPGKDVLNRGVSGTKTIDLINYKDRLITPYHPKQIFIYEGDNDIGYKWTPEEILFQIKKLFFILREEKPEAELIFISIKPSVRRLKDTERIEKTNALIKEFVEEQENAAYADVYTPMFTPEGELYPEHYREDGLHLTPAGYAVWKEVISKYIK